MQVFNIGVGEILFFVMIFFNVLILLDTRWVSVVTWAQAQGFDLMRKEALAAFKNTN